MSLMLNTLKSLEHRGHTRPAKRVSASPSAEFQLRICPTVDEVPQIEPIVAEPIVSDTQRSLEACLLPLVSDVAPPYVDLAAELIANATGEGQVVLLVGADRECASAFSMVEVAQALALQATGKVLLVDFELGGIG